MGTVGKIRKTELEAQLEDLLEFSKDNPETKLAAVMIFGDPQQVAFSFPTGIDYITILGMLEVAKDSILQEMREGEYIH